MSEIPTPPPSALLPNPSSSAMLGTTSPHTEFLPPIPELIGIKNVEEWKYAVRVYLNHHGLLDFIDGTHEMGQANSNVESPESWRRRRAHAFTILNGKIGKVMPALLTAGLTAYDDDYNFDPQELWNYICRYIRVGTRSDSLKDRLMFHMFNPGYLLERFDQDVYILMCRRLRELGVEVHPKIMERLGVEECVFAEDGNMYLHNLLAGHAEGKWSTEGSLKWNISTLFEQRDFGMLAEEDEDEEDGYE